MNTTPVYARDLRDDLMKESLKGLTLAMRKAVLSGEYELIVGYYLDNPKLIEG